MKFKEIVMTTLFICIGVYILFKKIEHTNEEEYLLSNGFSATKGKVSLLWARTIKNRYPLNYKYKVAGEEYTGIYQDEPCTAITKEDKGVILEADFVVVYSIVDSSISRMLLKEDDYAKFQLPYNQNIHLEGLMNRYFINCK